MNEQDTKEYLEHLATLSLDRVKIEYSHCTSLWSHGDDTLKARLIKEHFPEVLI